MAIAEKALQKGPIVSKNAGIVRLEGELHERRTLIKGRLASLGMMGTLASNNLVSSADFAAARNHIVDEVRTLGYQQHLTRKELRPLKKTTERKKSPNKPPRENVGQQIHAVVFEVSNQSRRKPATNKVQSFEHNQKAHELWVLRKTGEITNAEYTRRKESLTRR